MGVVTQAYTSDIALRSTGQPSNARWTSSHSVAHRAGVADSYARLTSFSFASHSCSSRRGGMRMETIEQVGVRHLGMLLGVLGGAFGSGVKCRFEQPFGRGGHGLTRTVSDQILFHLNPLFRLQGSQPLAAKSPHLVTDVDVVLHGDEDDKEQCVAPRARELRLPALLRNTVSRSHPDVCQDPFWSEPPLHHHVARD